MASQEEAARLLDVSPLADVVVEEEAISFVHGGHPPERPESSLPRAEIVDTKILRHHGEVGREAAGGIHPVAEPPNPSHLPFPKSRAEVQEEIHAIVVRFGEQGHDPEQDSAEGFQEQLPGPMLPAFDAGEDLLLP